MSESLEQMRRRLDPGDMLGRVLDFPVQMESAWNIGREFARGLHPVPVSRVIVVGMGGSAIGGDMARAFVGDRLRMPLISCRDYALPSYALDETLVVISSYSGNTAETLAAFDTARRGGAAIVAVTSGGAVAARCKADDLPVCLIPGGMPPRSALGFSLLPMLQILRAYAAAGFDDGEYTDALAAAKEMCASCGPDRVDNAALDLARRLAGKVPFVYGASGLMDAVVRRWVCQFNENSKMLAHWGTFPELGHNEIVGWESSPNLMKDAVVVALSDPDDPVATQQQMAVSLDIIEPLAGAVVRPAPVGGGRLARMIGATLLGDFTSVYLAYLNGLDPTPVEKIDRLKQKLSKSAEA